MFYNIEKEMFEKNICKFYLVKLEKYMPQTLFLFYTYTVKIIIT